MFVQCGHDSRGDCGCQSISGGGCLLPLLPFLFQAPFSISSVPVCVMFVQSYLFPVYQIKALFGVLMLSLYRFYSPPWVHCPSLSCPYSTCFGRQVSGMWITCPVHCSWWRVMVVATLGMVSSAKTLMFVCLSLQLILRIFGGIFGGIAPGL